MNYRIITLLVSCIAAIYALAHNLDSYTHIVLSKSQMQQQHKKAHKIHLKSYDDNDDDDFDDDDDDFGYYPCIIEINDENAIDKLLDANVVIFYRRDNLVLADVPYDALALLSGSKYFNYVQVAKPTSLTCDVARNFTNIDIVHSGKDGIQGYDGAGIIAGICDVGFDPGHIAFKNKIGMLSQYNEYEAFRTVYAPGSSLQTDATLPGCDTDEETHGTHTSNILAGARENNPYYGAAPGAQLAVSTSLISDMGFLCGVEDIIAYAKEQNKPAVVNISLGSYTGPHDGTDNVCRYLDLLGKEAIICFSAGNSGYAPYSLQYDFAKDDDQIGSLIDNYQRWDGFDVYGMIDIWSADSRSFELQFVAYDRVDKKFIYESEWVAGDKAVSNDDENNIFYLEFDEVDALASHFSDSYVYAYWQTDPHNNRYNATFTYELYSDEELSEDDQSARYVFGWRARAKQGVHIDCNTEGSTSFFRRFGAPGMVGGTSDFSISNLCCAHNTISVGSCNSRNAVPISNANDMVYSNYEVGTVSDFTSHGTLVDGRTLPHFCAPGRALVSAIGTEYQESTGGAVSYETTIDGTTYYWQAMNGTSMASPMAAGIIALWLQADPTLTVNQALAVAEATAQTNFSDITDVRWGAGCIDAFAGLKQILNSGVANVSNADVAFRIDGRRIISTAPVTIHDTMGRRYSQDNELAPGLYIVSTPQGAKKVSIN